MGLGSAILLLALLSRQRLRKAKIRFLRQNSRKWNHAIRSRFGNAAFWTLKYNQRDPPSGMENTPVHTVIYQHIH